MNIKTKLLALSFFFVLSVFDGFAQGFGEREELSSWYFNPAEVRLGGSDSLDHSSWQEVRLPHDWSVHQQADSALASCTGYLTGGIGWYRTTIDIPEDNRNRFLYFEGVYRNSEVYINGYWLGYRPNGYVSFMYDITPYVRKGQNVVAVRVDHSEDADSRWYTGSGIYRKVYLVTANLIHIDQWGIHVTTQVENGEASVQIHSLVKNETVTDAQITLDQELIDRQGSIVAEARSEMVISHCGKAEITQKLLVRKPQLWDLNDPYLYTLRTLVLDENGQILDQATTKVGIRTITFDPNKGFALNDEWMKIKGVCLHHDAGILGSAVPKEVWKERLLTLKEIGVNGIRMSHNPQATDLYDLCDELGFLVMDEAFDEWEYPKKKWIEGWNKGKPGFQGYAAYFREWGKRDIAAMVRRDRNHPSIIMWSIGNEVDFPNDPYSHPILDSEGIGQIHTAGYLPGHPNAERLGDIAYELSTVVKTCDTSRPVTAALAGAVMSNETDYPKALDVVGYNYTESRYQMDHDKYPQRVLYGSETRHNIEAWKAVEDNDFIFGQFLWTGIDYLGEAGPWPSRGSSVGLLDFAGNIKPRGYFRKSLWTKEPMVYIGTYPVSERYRNYLSIDAPHAWEYDLGQSIRVMAYTNCEEAELLLNGKVIGKKKQYNDHGIIHWDVPYASGKLEVLAYGKDGKVIARDFIKTAKAPKKMEAEIKGKVPAGPGDVAMIELKILDVDGDVVYNATDMISCKIEGPGKLLGLENASYDASENYTTNSLRCNNGRLKAYIQCEAGEGQIKMIFDSPKLKAETIILKIN